VIRTVQALSLGIFAISLLAAPTVAGETSPAPEMLFIARHLDVLSFPNSIGPRRRPGAKTLMDYGFTQFRAKANRVEANEDDGQWYFAIELVADHGDSKELCVTDQATNGGTYATRSLIKVRLGADGLFHATNTPVEGNSC